MNQKSVFLFLFVALFGIFAVGIVSADAISDAQADSLVDSGEAVSSSTGVISDLLQSIPSFDKSGSFIDAYLGGMDVFSSILLAALLFMLVYSVVKFVPFIGDQPAVQLWFSIIVSLLSFMYIPIDTIKAMLINYEVVGVVLTSVIPFLILVVFCVELETQKAKVAAFVNPPLILFFIGYSGYKTYSYFRSLESWTGSAGIFAWIYTVTFILSILFFLFRNRITHVFEKYINKASEAQWKSNLRLELDLKIRDLQTAMMATMNGQERVRIQQEINRLEAIKSTL